MAPTSLQGAQDCVQKLNAGAMVGASLGSFVAGILLALLFYYGRKLYRCHLSAVKQLDKYSRKPRNRKLSEEGWSWREKPSAFPSMADLSAQNSRDSTVVGSYGHTPVGTPSHSVPSLPLPALLKEKGLCVQPDARSLRAPSRPPSYHQSSYELEADSPASLYSQASAATYMHHRITTPPEDIPPVPMIQKHPLSRKTDPIPRPPKSPKRYEGNKKHQQIQTDTVQPRSILKRSSGQTQ